MSRGGGRGTGWGERHVSRSLVRSSNEESSRVPARRSARSVSTRLAIEQHRDGEREALRCFFFLPRNLCLRFFPRFDRNGTSSNWHRLTSPRGTSTKGRDPSKDSAGIFFLSLRSGDHVIIIRYTSFIPVKSCWTKRIRPRHDVDEVSRECARFGYV